MSNNVQLKPLEDSRVTEVKSFMTTDGNLFSTRAEADIHQIEIDFDQAFDDETPLGNYEGSRAQLSEVKRWISDHADLVIEWIQATRK